MTSEIIDINAVALLKIRSRLGFDVTLTDDCLLAGTS
jgi:hypothetical protein